VDALPFWLNAALFAVAAAVIWHAGTRLEHYADAISKRTGLGEAFTGMLLLATATSLPELATTVTAVAILGNPTLGVHNLLGGVAFQTALLVVADRCSRRAGALTFFTPRFVLLIEGVGLILLLLVTIGGVTARGVPVVLSVSAWSLLLFLAYGGVMYLVYRHRGQPRWTPTVLDDQPRQEPEVAARREPPPAIGGGGAGQDDPPLRRVSLLFLLMALLVLAGGWVAAETADTVAKETGLGSAFVGATLLAAATSLPELSTTMAAARNGRYTAAISNVFGSNAFDVALVFLADVLHRDGSVLARAEHTVVFVAALGAVMTCIYLWGLMERENRTLLGVGWDSATVVAVYAGGMAVLYVIQ
jgi:cation:H+ antiporter